MRTLCRLVFCFPGVRRTKELSQVDAVNDLREPADDSGTLSDNQFKVVHFPSAQ
jgi:hypothetical protein